MTGKDMKVIDQLPETLQEKITRLEILVDSQADTIRDRERKMKDLKEYNDDARKARDDMQKERDDARSVTANRRARFATFVGYATAIIIVSVISWTLYNIMSLEYPAGAPSIIGHILEGKSK